MNKNVFTLINCFIQEIHCHRVGQREVLTALGIQTMIIPARNDPGPSKRLWSEAHGPNSRLWSKLRRHTHQCAPHVGARRTKTLPPPRPCSV